MEDRLMSQSELLEFLKDIKAKSEAEQANELPIDIKVSTELQKDEGKFTISLELDVDEILANWGDGFSIHPYGFLIDHVKKCLKV